KDLMKTIFEEERATSIVNEMIEQYKPEIQEHINRWGYPSSYSTWVNYSDRMVNFASKRPNLLINQMLKYLELENAATFPFKVQLNSNMGNLKVNSLILEDTNLYEGEFYDQLTMTMEAIPKNGHRFIGWYDSNSYLMSANKRVVITPHQSFEMEARFELGDEIIIDDDLFEFPGFVIFSSIFTLSTMSYLTYLLMDAKKKLKFPFNVR
ncbi:MAG: CotH kinase family protein, partial [Acholeplasmataceae bacterium]|nr:CotH kinase family protein [Acholeplasmataceae bacterium]